MKAVRRAILAVGLGVLGSQGGHLIAYQVRFGTAASQLQSSGAHAYFPAVTKTALGLLGITLVGALLVVAAGRLLAMRDLRRRASGPSYLSLVAALFTIQLAVFAGQETAESALAGLPAGSISTLLLWGTLGQLPVAAVAALALRWLGARFEAAVEEIVVAARLRAIDSVPAAAFETAFIASWPEPLHGQAARSVPRKRGPPPSLRIRPD